MLSNTQATVPSHWARKAVVVKPYLLPKVVCPVCSSDALELVVFDSRGDDVRNGIVLCIQCGEQYEVREGIAFLYKELSASVAMERRGLKNLEASIREIPSEETLLSLPRRFEIPSANPDFGGRYWRVVSANVQYMLDLLVYAGSPGDSGGMEVPDIGAGIGWTSNELTRRGCRVVAVDISDTVYTGLRGGEFFMNRGLYFERMVADMDTLPLSNEGFDIVFASAALHHSRDLARLLRSIHKLLRPLGRIVIVNETTAGLLRKNWGFGAQVGDLEGHERIYFLWDWLKWLREAGFRSQVHFPPSVDCELRHGSSEAHTFGLVRRLLHVIWNNRVARTSVKRLMLYPGLIVLGMS